VPLSFSVLVTWTLLAGWVMLLGAFAGSLARPRVGTVASLRVALWFGFAIAVLLVLVPNLFVPLVGTAEVLILVGTTVIAVIAWLVVRPIVRRRSAEGRAVPAMTWPGWWVAVPIGGLVLLLLLLAHFFAGPVTNYDSGLYHLNAIQFAADYPTIHGLANFQDRLGTNVSSFNLAAVLGNTGWGIESFRLLVGLFGFLVATDLSLRLLDGSRKALRLPGTYVLMIAVLLAVPFLVANPGYWVTSPSADTTAMFMSVVAGAYLADAVGGRRSTWGIVALVTAVLAASIRTQLWVFAFLVAVALLLDWWLARRGTDRPRSRPRVLTLVGLLLSAAILVTMMIRDLLLSGWLLFPAAYLPMPVSWRVPDTTAVREWLLSWAREPGVDPKQTLASWDWLWPWVGRTLDDWAIRGALGLLLLALLIVLARRHWSATTTRPWARRLGPLVAVAPALGTLAVWFWTAPDPRFAWGPIVLVGAIPAAFALASLDASRGSSPGVGASRLPVAAIVTAGFMSLAIIPPVVAGLTQVRGFIADGYEFRTFTFGPIGVAASINPVPVPAVTEFTLPTGETLVVPEGGDQCWLTFPNCRPYADPNLRFDGASVADGFSSAVAG
jgi:hypothetical protein